MASTQVRTKKVARLFQEGGPASPAVLGGKGAGLAELARDNVPVPPGFTVTTAVARAFAQHKRLPNRLAWQLDWQIAAVEKACAKTFGAVNNPLLLSVRSGAPVSMPGMMDTILNLGLNPATVRGLAKLAGARFAYDCYRRFLQMFADVVLGVCRHKFEEILESVKLNQQAATDQELTASALQEVCNRFRTLIEQETGKSMIDSPREQLLLAIIAVLKSWDNPRAKTYRQAQGIPDHIGTAVNVQAMVFGNLNDRSCTGVVFSRNIATGTPGLWGEFLVNAQGEDVVAGIRKPLPIGQLKEWDQTLYAELADHVETFAINQGQAVDVEFTVESGKLWILQKRAAKLTAEAAATVAVHRVWNGELSKEAALRSVSSEQLAMLRKRGFNQTALDLACRERLLAKGLAASPGVATGRAVFTSSEAVEAATRGEAVILVRQDTSPEDLAGMLAAKGIVTRTGGRTCHAAVVACGMGIPAVVGCGNGIDFMDVVGKTISLDGSAAVVVLGEVELDELARKKEINLFLRWLAQEEAKQCPKPRLVFETFEQSKDASSLLGDFYLSEHMVRATLGTPLQAEAALLRSKVHIDVAERLAMYLVVAVGGELRHGYNIWLDPAKTELARDFAVRFTLNNGDLDNDTPSRRPVQKEVVARLAQSPQAAHLRFLELAFELFNNGKWQGSVGGYKWANIAQAAHHFLSGKLNHSVFADHAFDLQHNNGTIFGKNPMLECADRLSLQHMLDQKKQAQNPKELFSGLRLVAGLKFAFSDAVVALYRKGASLGLWQE
ncbi:MAG: pyruvate, phosphate dikinase [Candidatus Obscuribacterales bacterium]|nr:pyruvate, phosphate dikinase [Candidatus Obscuribacterales bacterium]